MGNSLVFCKGCSKLFYLGGDSKPMCLGHADFMYGFIRRRIDVYGIVAAEKANIHNDCVCRSMISLQAWKVRKWLLWRLNDGNKLKIKEASIKGYSVGKENQRKKENCGEDLTAAINETIDRGEGVLPYRGIDGDDQPSTPDTVGSDDVENPGVGS